MDENTIKIQIKNLAGQLIVHKISKKSLCQELHEEVAIQINEPFDMVKLMWQGKSLLTFQNMFLTLEDLGMTDGSIIYIILRFGGPEPEERAVFEFIKSNDPLFTLDKLKTLFQNQAVSVECPICMNSEVNRIISCYHWMCPSC